MCDMGAWMIVWLVVVFAALALAVAGTVWLMRSLGARDDSRPQLPPADPAQRELRRRYAAGEIDREEYLQRKVDLEP